MTIKTSGSLSLGEIQNEFGGSNDIRLTEYLAGGQYVTSGTIGFPGGVATPIPSSVPIRISNFYGASAEPSTVDIANYFWNNRRNLIRYSNVSNYPPLDGGPGGASGTSGSYTNISNYEYFYWNNPNGRYVNSITNNWSYANSSLPLTSSFFTVLTASAGQINNYGGLTASSISPGTLISDTGVRTYIGNGTQPAIGSGLVGDGYGISFDMKVYQGQIRDITSGSVTTTHAGGNAGVWTYKYIIPGKWTYGGFTNFDPLSYSASIGPGEMHFTLLERGGNGRQEIPPPSYPQQSPFKVFSVDGWWYNGADAQIAVNTTSSTQTFTYVGTFTDTYYGGTFQGTAFPNNHTPRLAVKLTRYY